MRRRSVAFEVRSLVHPATPFDVGFTDNLMKQRLSFEDAPQVLGQYSKGFI